MYIYIYLQYIILYIVYIYIEHIINILWAPPSREGILSPLFAGISITRSPLIYLGHQNLEGVIIKVGWFHAANKFKNWDCACCWFRRKIRKIWQT